MTDTTPEDIKRYAALEWHLRYNHVPAIPTVYVGAAQAAIEAAGAGALEKLITLEEGLLINGARELKASELIEIMHLEDFLE